MNKQYIPIDINEHFNCKAILNRDEVEKAKVLLEFVGIRGHFFEACNFPEPGPVTVQNIPFIIPDKSYNKYDIIACEAQEIHLPPNNYIRLHILCTAALDFSHEVALFNFTDGSTNDFMMDFMGWNALFGKTEWKYEKLNCLPGIVGNDFRNMKRGIYYFTHPVPQNGTTLKSIELPWNPDTFVFALTMESEE